ncbi:MAG: SAM-dependent methyltransferase [Clostridia bacterium]|nr:SAM-dependent methyltransferase [Clostridia bacterium]
MKHRILPDSRLASAIPYIRRGGCVADIGTDHAYLPIHLVQEGIVSRALACDINEGPIRAARENIAAQGLEAKIDTLCTDGLHGVEPYAPDDILIFGMGGELIVKILGEAPWIKDARFGLILQPMSRPQVLRAWLLKNGFSILGERISFEDRYYQTVHARFVGKTDAYTEEELLLGKRNLEGNSPYLIPLIKHEIAVLESVLDGKSKARTADTEKEVRILHALKNRLERLQ